MYSRQKMVDLVTSWIGLNEADGSYKKIIDIYNSYSGNLPRGTKMQYDWAWCACTWSAAAIKLGYTAIIPIEISCYYIIEEAKKMGCWQESDSYIPQPGDAVLYDWEDSGVGDNTGVPDHIGTVVEVNKNGGYFIVVEGNYSNAVKKRTMAINGKFIRGFIVPKYDDNIAGSNPQGQTTNKKVTATASATRFDKTLAGEYTTTIKLYCRDDAGIRKKALVRFKKGAKVNCYGYYSIAPNGVKWLYVQATVDGVLYTGFSSIKYLKK